MPMRRCRAAVLIALICVLASGRLWAWGCSGHETVALIALKNLHDLDAANQTQIAQQVETLLSAQTRAYKGRFCKDLDLDPMAYFATWADDHRTVDPSTGNWHFWDIPLYVKSAALGEYCDGGCVVQALLDQIAILQDKTKDDAARSTALLYIIHFAGDMHQPLHEEDNNDRGGNCVPVTFLDTAPRRPAAVVTPPTCMPSGIRNWSRRSGRSPGAGATPKVRSRLLLPVSKHSTPRIRNRSSMAQPISSPGPTRPTPSPGPIHMQNCIRASPLPGQLPR